ncbi:MAG: Crp/Fnr family transcriptional regulator [Clostridiales bacterium]|nr:Crp/Fnr family transcriptional regulator [Clostridiales bacterium]
MKIKRQMGNSDEDENSLKIDLGQCKEKHLSDIIANNIKMQGCGRMEAEMTPYQFYTEFCRIKTPEVIQKLVDATEIRSIRKGDCLIRTGDSQSNICFLIKGLLRGFFLDSSGKDITDCFGFQTGTVAMTSCQFDEENISPMTVEMLEDSLLFCVPIPLILKLQERHLEVTMFYNRLLISALNEHWHMKQVLHQYTALQRYQWFLEAYPGLADRVSNKNIASFLGMSPETLSRLRRTIKRQQELP